MRQQYLVFFMIRILFFSWLLITTTTVTIAQKSDFIVLKKQNNRHIKTYFPGVFISGKTYSGFSINGIIKDIRNDSVFVEQQHVQQVQTQFGVPALDTTIFTVGLHYQEIKSLFYSKTTGIGGVPRKRGLSSVSIPKLLMIGGTGYIVLELVNTGYRRESLSDRDKLRGLGIAAGLAAIGFFWQQLTNQSNKAGGKYKVVYVRMEDRN